MAVIVLLYVSIMLSIMIWWRVVCFGGDYGQFNRLRICSKSEVARYERRVLTVVGGAVGARGGAYACRQHHLTELFRSKCTHSMTHVRGAARGGTLRRRSPVTGTLTPLPLPLRRIPSPPHPRLNPQSKESRNRRIKHFKLFIRIRFFSALSEFFSRDLAIISITWDEIFFY